MVARVKDLRNRGKEKKSETGNRKKIKCKFWLMCVLDLKIFYIFVRNLGKSVFW